MQIRAEARRPLDGERIVVRGVAVEPVAKPCREPSAAERLAPAITSCDAAATVAPSAAARRRAETIGHRETPRRRRERAQRQRAPSRPVRREDAEVIAARRSHRAGCDDHHARERPKLHAVLRARRGQTALAAPRKGADVGAREHRVRVGRPRDRERLAGRLAATDDEAAAERAQGAIEIRERREEELEAVGPRVATGEQRVVEHEQRHDALARVRRLRERGMVVHAQIAREEHDGRAPACRLRSKLIRVPQPPEWVGPARRSSGGPGRVGVTAEGSRRR